MKQHGVEKKAAIETCIRSFIIKAIHSIVQARNGIVYNSNCISAVGARNNLMVNIEEDPEIGATIKHTLHASFPVHVRDLLTLEIITVWPNHARTIVEIWQFSLDTSERLDEMVVGNKPYTDLCLNSTDDIAEIALEDLRQSRLFEKLGTLLKSIIIATRLLPAYRFSREQSPDKYQMCYVLRRGSANLSRLGPSVKCQQVGRLFSGLAINSLGATPSEQTVQKDIADSLDRIFLNCRVHYCSDLPSAPPAVRSHRAHVPTPKQKWIADGSTAQADDRYHHTRAEFVLDRRHSAGYPRVFPAFSEHDVDESDDEDLNPMFIDPQHDYYPKLWANGDEYDNPDEEYSEELEDMNNSDLEDTDISETIHRPHIHGLSSENVDAQANDPSEVTPLQLPFSTAGVSGDRLTHLFKQLREQADLDLFRIPNPNAQAQSPLFDADALSCELDQHENTLKEFDDFLSEFCRSDSYLTEVRPLAGNLKVPARSGPFAATETS